MTEEATIQPAGISLRVCVHCLLPVWIALDKRGAPWVHENGTPAGRPRPHPTPAQNTIMTATEARIRFPACPVCKSLNERHRTVRQALWKHIHWLRRKLSRTNTKAFPHPAERDLHSELTEAIAQLGKQRERIKYLERQYNDMRFELSMEQTKTRRLVTLAGDMIVLAEDK